MSNIKCLRLETFAFVFGGEIRKPKSLTLTELRMTRILKDVMLRVE